jgi:hypothetical protein
MTDFSGSTAFAGRAQTLRTEQATKRFATEVQVFDLVELFGEMVIVEAGVLGACQAQEGLAGALGEAAVAGSAAVGVSQRRLPAFANVSSSV